MPVLFVVKKKKAKGLCKLNLLGLDALNLHQWTSFEEGIWHLGAAGLRDSYFFLFCEASKS